jgi:hypothetical protein
MRWVLFRTADTALTRRFATGGQRARALDFPLSDARGIRESYRIFRGQLSFELLGHTVCSLQV